MRRWTRLAPTLLALAVAGCTNWVTPDSIVDPAREAAEPGRFRGDRYDQRAMATLTRWGALFPALEASPSNDDMVVREALRVVPPSWAGTRSPRDIEADHMMVMILRRRPRAAYVELMRAMRSASDPNVRAGAADQFASLDSRGRGGTGDVMRAYVGPEREAAVAVLESLLLSDPSHLPRQAASYAWMWQLASPMRPSTAALRDLLSRESDSTVRRNVEEILAAREPGSAPRSAAPGGGASKP